jgi:hypothetical protein
VARLLGERGLLGYRLVATENHETAYLAWPDGETATKAFAEVASIIGADAAASLDSLVWGDAGEMPAFLDRVATGPKLFHRFWIGTKLPALSAEEFRAGLNETFIPKTVELGKTELSPGHHPLVSYVPALLPTMPERPSDLAGILPDEIALVTYRSESEYRALRATPAGEAYSALHWDYFERDSSRSRVAGLFTGTLDNDQAYALLDSGRGLQSGAVTLRVLDRQGVDNATLASRVESARAAALKAGVRTWIVLVTERFLYETVQAAEALPPTGLGLPVIVDLPARKVPAPANPGIRFGEAVNTQF